MKKLLLLIMLLNINFAFAYEPAISKYVSGSKLLDCKETVFLSGEPVTMEGTLDYKVSGKSDKLSETYNYKLENDEGDSITRQLTFNVSSETKTNGQATKKWELTKFSESVKIGNDTYTLDSYDISRSQIEEVKPIGTYYAGNISINKKYSKNDEEITLSGVGTVYGYNTVWAKNETVDMSYKIFSETDNDNSWTGRYTTTTSDTDQIKIRYLENRPTEISFDGSFMTIENNISTFKYTSEMPEIYNEKHTDYIVKDKGAYKYESFPVESRIPNYTIQGIKGHWGEMAIRQAFAMEYMDEWDDKTSPDSAVTRGEFAKIIAKVIKLEVLKYSDNKILYRDVPVKNEYYSYIRALTEAGVVKGTGNSRFSPNAIVTRAEAVTMIINAIGFENKAPEPVPNLNFVDNYDIPVWAEKFIYMANKIGILNGNEKGEIMPNKQLTKAEIASIANNLVKYLTEELSEEYVK